MSMKTYFIYNYGLWISQETLNAKYKDDIDDIIDDLRNLHSAMDFTTDDIDNEEIHPLKSDGSIDYSIDLNNDSGFLLPCSKSARIIGTAYESKADMIEDLKEQYQEFLPDNYNFEENIVYGEYSIFG